MRVISTLQEQSSELKPNDIVEMRPNAYTTSGTHGIVLRDSWKDSRHGYKVLFVGSPAGAKLSEYGSKSQSFLRYVKRKLDKGEAIKLLVE